MLRARQAAGERGEREERRPQRNSGGARKIAQPAAEQHEAAEGDMYAFTTQTSEVSVKPRSSRIDGRATFTIVVSSTSSDPAHST